jgi:CRP-like cAMP-binding protein
MRERLLQISCLGVRDRLVLMLGRLIRPYATEVGEGWLIANPLARTDMAALAGMTPETISRCIKQLEQENTAHFSRRSVLIPSRQRMTVEIERLEQ